jgi:hypothetical protein
MVNKFEEDKNFVIGYLKEEWDGPDRSRFSLIYQALEEQGEVTKKDLILLAEILRKK